MKPLLLSLGFLTGAAYVASLAASWTLLAMLFAVVFFVALGSYILLASEGNPARVRLPLLAGVLLVAVLVVGETFWVASPSNDFGWFSYGPSDQMDEMLRQMAERSLSWLVLTGSATLAGYACFLAAVWALPGKRNRTLAVVAGALTVLTLAAAVSILSNVDSRIAVWVAGLGLLLILVVAAVAGQRAGMAWLVMAGAVLLAWRSMDLLEGAVSSAMLAAPPAEPVMSRAFSVMVQDIDVQAVLLPAATVAGVLLIVLGCLPLRGTATSMAPPRIP